MKALLGHSDKEEGTVMYEYLNPDASPKGHREIFGAICFKAAFINGDWFQITFL